MLFQVLEQSDQLRIRRGVKTFRRQLVKVIELVVGLKFFDFIFYFIPDQ